MNREHALNETEAARLLWSHWQGGTTLDALPPGLRPDTRADGYGVQARLPDVAGRTVAGWKIAATSEAGQRHIGVDGPLAGRILSGQVHRDGAAISLHGNRMRVAEPEFAFRFGHSVPPRRTPYSVEEVVAAVEALHPAIEIPDSRFADFARVGAAQLLADNACAFRFVVGADATAAWYDLDLRSHPVHARAIRRDGSRLERSGAGSAVLGDPRAALTWLVNELSSLGITLAVGQFVSTGTCMGPLAIGEGDRVEADFGLLGSVSVVLQGAS